MLSELQYCLRVSKGRCTVSIDIWCMYIYIDIVYRIYDNRELLTKNIQILETQLMMAHDHHLYFPWSFAYQNYDKSGSVATDQVDLRRCEIGAVELPIFFFGGLWISSPSCQEKSANFIHAIEAGVISFLEAIPGALLESRFCESCFEACMMTTAFAVVCALASATVLAVLFDLFFTLFKEISMKWAAFQLQTSYQFCGRPDLCLWFLDLLGRQDVVESIRWWNLTLPEIWQICNLRQTVPRFVFALEVLKIAKVLSKKDVWNFFKVIHNPFCFGLWRAGTEMRRKLTKSSCSKARHQGADVLQKKW